MNQNKLDTLTNLFEDKEIRSVWDKEKEEYFFSVVDVVSALTDANIPRNYWSDLKRRLIYEGSEAHEKIVQLKLKAKDARDSYEKATKKSVLSSNNVLNYKYIDDNKKIENK